jgi:hypothetical protein
LPHQGTIEHRINVMTDAYVEAYAEWVDESIGVQEAYESWSSAASGDARLAFAAYRAALDREEHASKCFAALAA